MISELVKLAKTAADWIEKVNQDRGCLPVLPENSVTNSSHKTPTLTELVSSLRFHISRVEHPTYINVYRAVCGWQTALHTWDADGFYDVYSTGMGPYGHTKKGYKRACAEGKAWAEDEGVEFKTPPVWTKEEK